MSHFRARVEPCAVGSGAKSDIGVVTPPAEETEHGFFRRPMNGVQASVARVEHSLPGLLLLLALVAVLNGGCTQSRHRSSSSSPTAFSRYDQAPVPLRSEVVYSGSDLGVPAGLAVVGTLLVISDPYASPHIHVIDLSTGRVVRSFGDTGEGPDEYKLPISVLADEATDRIWIGDRALGRLTQISLDGIRTKVWKPSVRVIQLRGTAYFDVVLSLDPKGALRFLAGDVTGGSQFIELDSTGRIMQRLGPPAPNAASMPGALSGRLFAHVVARRPDGSILATGGVNAGDLEYYDRRGGLVDSVATPIHFSPSWKPGGTLEHPGLVATEDSRHGYLDLAATRSRLVALFSGRYLRKHPTDAFAGRDLQVYDWHGHLLSVYRADKALTSIAVDTITGLIYGTHWGLEPSVVRLRLPDPGLARPTGHGP